MARSSPKDWRRYYYGESQRTSAQDKTINSIAKRTANLKKEQYRMVDANGNIVIESKGTEHEVRTRVGDKREYGDGSVSIHNHPNGGTFSSADIRDFGFRVKEIVATAPEGVYRLINAKYGTKEATNGWLGLQEALEAIPEVSFTELQRKAQENLKNSPSKKEIESITATWAKIKDEKGMAEAQAYHEQNRERLEKAQAQYKQDLQDERRRLETAPHDELLRKRAKEFGFIYKFEPWKKKKK